MLHYARENLTKSGDASSEELVKASNAKEMLLWSIMGDVPAL